MIPTFLLSILGSKTGRTILLVVAGLIALGIAVAWFIHHERNLGAARCEAAVQAANDAERERETKINQDWQSWADGASANADKQKDAINELRRKNDMASVANNGLSCLPAGGARRVRSIGRPGSQADPAAGTGRAQR